MSEREALQWSRYIDAYGPLTDDTRLERIFARLDHGFAALAALIINRSGGLKSPGALANTPGTAVDPREYLWDRGPELQEPELTPEGAFLMLGGRGAPARKPPDPVLPDTL